MVCVCERETALINIYAPGTAHIHHSCKRRKMHCKFTRDCRRFVVSKRYRIASWADVQSHINKVVKQPPNISPETPPHAAMDQHRLDALRTLLALEHSPLFTRHKPMWIRFISKTESTTTREALPGYPSIISAVVPSLRSLSQKVPSTSSSACQMFGNLLSQ